MYQLELKIVVIGGNDAGLSAAGRAKRKNPNAKVFVFEQTPHVAYASCGMRYLLSGEIDADQLSGPDAETLSRRRGIDLFTEHRVVNINTVKRTVTVVSLRQEKTFAVRYHKLILTTGATSQLPDAFQIKAENCFTLRSFADAVDIDRFLKRNLSRHALVLGGGFIGLEVAESLLKRGMRVSLVEKENAFFPHLHDKMRKVIPKKLSEKGIRVYTGQSLQNTELKGDRVVQAQLMDGRLIDQVDLVVLATGIKPGIQLAQQANVPLGPSGAIQVNRHQQSRRLNIYAAGDCCESYHLISKKPVWAPYAATASKQGRVAGDNAIGGREIFPGVLNTFILRLFDVEFGASGLSESEAQQAGFDVNTAVIHNNDRAHYVKGVQELTVALVLEKKSKRLLGAQVMGVSGCGYRLSQLATALTAGFTAHDLAYVDLGYIPENSPVWDPVLIAAQVAKK